MPPGMGGPIVYAGIQADPLVARVAEVLADATTPQRILARAVMNGETTDPDGWRVMFPSLFGPGVDAAERTRSETDPGRVAGGRRARRAGPQPVPWCDRRGADGPAPRPTYRRVRGPPRAADPVRWRSGRDPSVRRDRRARRMPPRRGTASGAPAASTRTSCTSSTTRGGTRPTRTRRCGSASSSSTPVARVPFASSARPHRPRPRPSSRSNHSTCWPMPPRADADERSRGPGARCLHVPVSRAVRRMRAGRAPADLGPAALCPGSRLVSLGPARVHPGLVCGTRPGLVGPRGGGGGPRAGPGRR